GLLQRHGSRSCFGVHRPIGALGITGVLLQSSKLKGVGLLLREGSQMQSGLLCSIGELSSVIAEWLTHEARASLFPRFAASARVSPFSWLALASSAVFTGRLASNHWGSLVVWRGYA